MAGDYWVISDHHQKSTKQWHITVGWSSTYVLYIGQVRTKFSSVFLKHRHRSRNFLAVPRQLYRWPCHWVSDHCWKHYQRELWETCDRLWPIWHLIRVMKRHDMTDKKCQRQRQWQRQTQWQRHLENTLKEHHWRLVTFETLDQSDEETWSDQQQDNDKGKDNDNHKEQSQRLVTFVTLITFLTIENNNLNIHSDPWLKSDRDSIHNYCDVWGRFLEWMNAKLKYCVCD